MADGDLVDLGDLADLRSLEKNFWPIKPLYRGW